MTTTTLAFTGLELPEPVDHPARFSSQHLAAFTRLLEAESRRLGRELLVIDPFAGVGTVHRLARPGIVSTVGVELEPEWQSQHPDTLQGDATALTFEDDSFDVLLTSPAYGNRLADHHNAKDDSKRYGYQRSLGRPLSPGNGAGMRWGEEYRDIHRRAWAEAFRVLRLGALALVNVKNYPNPAGGGETVFAVEWHRDALAEAGFVIEDLEEIKSPGLPGEDHAGARRFLEVIIVARKPEVSA